MSDRLLLALVILGAVTAAGAIVQAALLRQRERLRQTMKLPSEAAARPRIIAFSGPGCAACRTQRHILEQIAAELGDRLAIEQVDAAAQPDLARRLGVMVVPTTVVAAPDGRIIAINGGLADAQRLREQLATAA